MIRIQIMLASITSDGPYSEILLKLGTSCVCLLIHEFRSCCGSSSYDWDDFMKIRGCCVGNHSEEKVARPVIKCEDDKNSPVPLAAQGANQSDTATSEPLSSSPENIQPFVTSSGLYKCGNAGCGKEYSPDINNDEACHFHSGKAGFRDTRKFWSCCNASSYDWDEFMKIPTCCIGSHQPKMIRPGFS